VRVKYKSAESKTILKQSIIYHTLKTVLFSVKTPPGIQKFKPKSKTKVKLGLILHHAGCTELGL